MTLGRSLDQISEGHLQIQIMVDHLPPHIRSSLMARVRTQHTKPEICVRQRVHRMGFRYRLHRRDLPGRPDLVFPGRQKVIFVHGCFWHQHDCSRGKRPASNTEFWNAKLDENIRRDLESISSLKEQGWSVLVVWECETKDLKRLDARIRAFIELTDCRRP